METQEILAKLEQAGVFLAVEGENLRLRSPVDCPPSPELVEQLREHKAEALSILKSRVASEQPQFCSFSTPIPCKTAKLKTPPIPRGAVLYAPRWDGGKPLATIPACWCCHQPYRLESLMEWRGQTYAQLEPGCDCLDVPQALACCCLCVEHCRCRSERGSA